VKTDSDNLPSLRRDTADYVASAVKAIVGAAPFAGSLLVEIAGNIIPNQRMERVVKYAKELEGRLAGLDQEFVKSQLTNENFTDLMEEGIRQAARSLSDERRGYLASAIANGISSEDVEFFESKHLLRILGEINDVEVIILRFYLVYAFPGDEEYREKHKAILRAKPMVHGDPTSLFDKNTLHGSYKEHLASIALLDREYEVERELGLLDIDIFTKGPKVRGYHITSFGKLLLRHIGLSDEHDRPLAEAGLAAIHSATTEDN